jgi:hypothetical protein
VNWQGEDVHGQVVDRAEIAERLKMLPNAIV